MATATARRNRTNRSAELNARPNLTPVPDAPEPETPPEPQPQPKPEKPVATVELGARPVTYWFPVATLSDGSEVGCQHSKYGHESEKAATSCIRALVASKGHKLA